ncbi:TetR family transcriptional regulator [Cryobacterium sp. CG_9.6]|uniref:TetR family transcriptional regulator n=1 Tax=Cryobacterium sp. CG_9.6 TaxID=2760710 RepID=UPI002473BEFF|nr:TetR family transcriptional regulator [Cryobacterium sp. CG_9.6]MDH6237549.1 AcrR family transcriptional regulator [Cryobacterium sp. CG_9.6]
MKTTLREDKHQATSQRLERNAVSLVLEHGFDAVTVDMICNASGISQRTFFNYFKTKEAAVVGAEPPTIDEGKARAFIATDGPDLLAEALQLVAASSMMLGTDEKLLTDRLRLFEKNPQLLLRQMDRMNRITAEIAELVYLRRRREAGLGADEADLREQADLLTHAVLGVLRYMAMRWIRDEGVDQVRTLAATVTLLGRTLRVI